MSRCTRCADSVQLGCMWQLPSSESSTHTRGRPGASRHTRRVRACLPVGCKLTKQSTAPSLLTPTHLIACQGGHH